MLDRDQQDVLIELGRKGGYVPIHAAGGPPPGEPELARYPQRMSDVPSSKPQPRTQAAPHPEQ